MLEEFLSEAAAKKAGFKIPSEVSLTTFFNPTKYKDDIALNVYLGHFTKNGREYNVVIIQRVRGEDKKLKRQYYTALFEGSPMGDADDYYFDEFLVKIKDLVAEENEVNLNDLDSKINELIR